MKELNEKGLGTKERSADFIFESLFPWNKDKDAAAKGDGGEYVDSEDDVKFRRKNEGDSEELMMDDDTTDLEFDDHWGVERKGENPLSSDHDNDSDEDGGELMPVFF